MPTIQFTLKDVQSLIGKKITLEQLKKYEEYAKGEVEGYDKDTDTVTMSCGDTNLPYLWSVEGIARLLKGVLGVEKGIAKLEVNKSNNIVLVDKSVSSVRPYLAMFGAKGKPVSDEFLRQLIQLQEKLDESFGRKRRKTSIGVYTAKKTKFPVTYKAVKPSEVKFEPLGFAKLMDLNQILKEHPTGIKYGFTLQEQSKFPILLDAQGKVMGFPPIINSNDLGKVVVGDDELIVEVTGTDEESVDTVCNILAYALSDRGFKISQVIVKYPDKEKITPFLRDETISITPEQVKSLLGIDLSKQEITILLEKARYSVTKDNIHIPPYRADILHYVDVIEDVAIMYGYENIPLAPLTQFTAGEVAPVIPFITRAREILAGFGMQEVLSPMLTNKEILYPKMNRKEENTVEIRDFMSLSYSCVRTSILPILLDVLGKNKHNPYPQKIFEQGLVTKRNKNGVHDLEMIATALCGAEVDYTVIRQVVDSLLNALGAEYAVEEAEHSSFILGRCARITVKGKEVAILGEIHPQVLQNVDVQLPVAACEINLSELYHLNKQDRIK